MFLHPSCLCSRGRVHATFTSILWDLRYSRQIQCIQHFHIFSTTPALSVVVVLLLTNHAHRETVSLGGDGASHAWAPTPAHSGNDVGAVSGRSTHGIRALRQGRWYVKSQSDLTAIFELSNICFIDDSLTIDCLSGTLVRFATPASSSASTSEVVVSLTTPAAPSTSSSSSGTPPGEYHKATRKRRRK